MAPPKSFSPEDKREISRLFNAPLLLADGNETTLGHYLSETLPAVIDEDEQRAKKVTLLALELMGELIKRSMGHDPKMVDELRSLRWENGSMERYFGSVDRIYDKLDTIPDDHIESYDPDLGNGLKTTFRQYYSRVVFANGYRDALAQLLEIAQSIQTGKPVDSSEESFLFKDHMDHSTYLEVALRTRGVQQDKLDVDWEEADDDRMPPEKLYLEDLAEKLYEDHYIPANQRPENSREFDQRIKALAARLQQIITGPGRGESMEAAV